MLFSSKEFWILIAFAYVFINAFNNKYRLWVYGAISYAVIALCLSQFVAALAIAIIVVLYVLSLMLFRSGLQWLRLASLSFVGVSFVLYSFVGDLVLSSLHNSNVGYLNTLWAALATVGMSYSFLRAYDYLHAVAEGEKVLGPVELFGYVFPFHMLIAGPIARYSAFISHNENTINSRLDYREFVKAINIILTGLVYKFVIAKAIMYSFWQDGISAENSSWYESYIFLIYLFFDFAGYSICALGIGKLLGIYTPLNFNKPFISTSIGEFWTRWHISLGEFVKVHVFNPVQLSLVRRFGIKHSSKATFVSAMVAFMFTGLWHRFDILYVYWALYLGVLVALEKYSLASAIGYRFSGGAKWVSVFIKIIGPVYVFVAISISLKIIWSDLF